MNRNRSKINILIILSIMLLSTFLSPLSAFANSDVTESKGNESLFIVITEDNTSVYSTENEQVGTLNKGAVLQLERSEGSTVFFQWGEKEAFVSEQFDVVQLDKKLFNDSEVVSYYESSSEEVLFDLEGNEIGKVAGPLSFPVFEESENTYSIILGGQLFLLKKQAVTSLVLNNVTAANSPEYFRVEASSLDVLESVNNQPGKKLGTLVQGESYQVKAVVDQYYSVSFGNKTGLVEREGTVPLTSKLDGNWNTLPNLDRTFTAKTNLEVFSTTAPPYKAIATIEKGVTYPIVQEFPNWIALDVGGKVGYIHKNRAPLDFHRTDLYFKVVEDNVPIYDKVTGTMKTLGYLVKGQEYIRLSKLGAYHKIKFGNDYAYVRMDATTPSTGDSIKNRNRLANSNKTFEPTREITVVDNSSGKNVPFSKLVKGVSYPVISESGNWITVDVAGRSGLVYKPFTKRPFTTADRYLEAIEDAVIYVQDGSLLPAGTLLKGQAFPRIKTVNNHQQIKFGDSIAYVLTSNVKPLDVTPKIPNLNNGQKVIDKEFIPLRDVLIYSDMAGNNPFATINQGQHYPILGQIGNWLKVDVGGRIGYLHNSRVQMGHLYLTTKYDKTLNEMLAIQMTRSPQTDKYRHDKAYVHSDYITIENLSATYPQKGTVNAASLNVRQGPGTSHWSFGSLKKDTTVEILGKTGDWYEISYGAWRNAKQEDVLAFLNPTSFKRDSRDYFQFLVLSERSGIKANDLNDKILKNKGILTGRGQAFLDAGAKHNINEIYLIAHAFLETGHGSSTLANGILVTSVDGKAVTPKVVYNMFGIGAYDRCPISCGAETAYKNGWFTPEASIIGGAQFISSMYVNHPTYKQNTLYKMRWNPSTPGEHQYATDVGWASKQVRTISDLYDMLDRYTLTFDVPSFK